MALLLGSVCRRRGDSVHVVGCIAARISRGLPPVLGLQLDMRRRMRLQSVRDIIIRINGSKSPRRNQIVGLLQ